MPEYSREPVITRKEDVGKESTGQSAGMTRKAALTGVAPNICASVMLAAPHSSSSIHTHGSQNTIIYARRGVGKIVYSDGRASQTLHEGDFALIPAYCQHQEVNDGDEEVEWIITRSGEEPIVENLNDWGGK